MSPISDALNDKLSHLPKEPGVYFHKNSDGEIIYVGKAAVLRNRVRQYFQKSRRIDPKTEALVNEISDTDWIVVGSEIEALFLEAEMIRRYMPQYNILLRDDKSNLYVRIDSKSEAPYISFVRRPIDDGADYFGPYLSGFAVKKALRYLRKIFPYSTHSTLPSRACLQYHIGLCPGPETESFDELAYRKTLRQLKLYLRGQVGAVTKELEKEMKLAAKLNQFEQAAKLRDQIRALSGLKKHVIFSDSEQLDISKDHAIADLKDLFSLKDYPRRIEGFDISHLQGTDTVASMVVFTNGLSDKGSYRKFKMRIPGNDDFIHMNETILRRFGQKHSKDWPMPNLMLIDGGKGQLSSALKAMNEQQKDVPMFGLAKKVESIIVSKNSNTSLDTATIQRLNGVLIEGDEFYELHLPHTSHIIKLLQRIRDEAHRFAVTYHSTLRLKRQTSSIIEEIPGVGAATKKKLIKHFGSLRAVSNAELAELAVIVGEKKAKEIHAKLRV